MFVRVVRSRWWFMLPIIMQFIGGIIAYYALRQDDPTKARNCLLLGVALSAIWFAVFVLPIILLIATMPSGQPIDELPYEDFMFLNPNFEA